MPFSTSSFVQSGQFKNVRVIGQGAFGTIYYAEDNNLGRAVAVKEALPAAPQFQNARAQFEKEGRIHASLHHQNIVAVYNLLEDPQGGELYLVCEYLNGGTIEDYLKTQGKLTEDLAIKIALDICAALDATWAEQIVHRDIKPSNILLKADSNSRIISAKLVDFGVAQDQKGARTTIRHGMSHHPGAPAYMAPEQGNIANMLDVRADIYALGITLWEMLTCTDYKPILAKTGKPDLHQYNPQASSGIALIIQKAVKQDPAQRYLTPQDMAEDLRLVRAGKPPKHATAQGTIAPWHRRRLSFVLISALLALGVIMCVYLFLGVFGRTSQVAREGGTPTTASVSTQQETTSVSGGGIATSPTPSETSTVNPTATPEPPKTTSTPQPTESPTPQPPTPTPTAKPGDMLYQASWSNGMNGWVGSQGWTAVGGMLTSNGYPSFPTGEWLRAPYKPDTPDYAIEAEIAPLNLCGNTFYSFGLVARGKVYDPSQGGYPEGILAGVGCDNVSVTSTNTEVGKSSFPLEKKRHLYRLEVKGNTIRLLVDGALLVEGKDNQNLDSGIVGLHTAGVQLEVYSFKVIKL